ncbi:MAG: terminase large subunit, partial [Pirellulaceae bacterium]|nr:terminase large subunit [Pirellulaceae bacterium]
QDKANFKQWAKDGYLAVIPGDTIKQVYIRDQLTELATILKIRCLIFDKTYAQEFTEWCQEEHPQIECVEFGQSSAMMERPIDDFESYVRDHTLRHDNNPCLNWQAGNCEIRESHRGHRILCKPKQGDFRKIDGMVSSVMSAWGATALGIKSSVYNRRGILVI